MDIRDLCKKINECEDKEITLEGWGRNNRKQSNFLNIIYKKHKRGVNLDL